MIWFFIGIVLFGIIFGREKPPRRYGEGNDSSDHGDTNADDRMRGAS